MTDTFTPVEGHCTCGKVRYRMARRPLFIHACHCTWCQRETGTAFALNALIESDEVTLVSGTPESILTPSNSGKGQHIVRCPDCRVAVWSHYAGAGFGLMFVRVGTLEHPESFAPDIHIFTSTKLPWVVLPDGVPAVPEYYKSSDTWPAESLERRARLFAKPG